MADFDPGPPALVARHFAKVPSYADYRELFWYDWGPVFYRGRLNRTARLLAIASDPGPTERVALRTLVGDAGQRVQGFLTKLGLTQQLRARQRLRVRAAAVACPAGRTAAVAAGPAGLAQHASADDHRAGVAGDRRLRVPGPLRSAAVGRQAERAGVRGAASVEPRSEGPGRQLATGHHRAAARSSPRIPTVMPPDRTTARSSSSPTTRRSRPRDLPFGVPPWLGDDAWGRKDKPRHNNSVERPATDLLNTLVWRAPKLG